MNDFEKIEDLLLAKRYEELSSAELREVNEYFENGSEYNDMRETLMQVKSTLAADKLLIKPSVDMKESLLNKFQQTYGQVKPTNPIPFYKKTPFQWSAAASVVIILSLGIFGVLNNIGGNKEKNMAVNYDSNQPEQQNQKQSPAITDTTTVYSVATGDSKSDEIISSDQDGFIPSNEAPETKEVNKPVITTNSYSVEESIMEGESTNGLDDMNMNQQESNDESEKSENKSLEYNKDIYNTTIPVQGNSTLDNSTIIDQKARNTYQNKKKHKSNNEDKNIQQGGITNTSILGNTTKTEVTQDSVKVDSNIDQLNRRAINIPKADSLEKQN